MLLFLQAVIRGYILRTCTFCTLAQSTRAVEYTDCIFADPLPKNVPFKTQKIWWWGSSVGTLRNVEYYPNIAIVSYSTWTWLVAPARILSMGQIELCDI